MHTASPGHAGGLESAVLELTERLQGRGHAVLLAALIHTGTVRQQVPVR